VKIHFSLAIGSLMEERYGIRLASRDPDLIAPELRKLLGRWDLAFEFKIHPAEDGWNLEVEEADLIAFYFFIGKLKEENIF
jgi:hypothetical protein